MELFFVALLLFTLAVALGLGFPVAFAIPGSAILTICIATLCGYLFFSDVNAFFVHGGGPYAWLAAGVTNFRTIYRSDAGDTLIAIPLFIFMGLMLQRSRVAEDLLTAMAQLFGAVRGGLGIAAILVGALLAASTSVIGATVVAMGMISLPTMLQNKYSKPLATGVVAATGTLGQIIPPSIVLLILVHQLTTAVNHAGAVRRALYKASTGELFMPSTFDVPSVSAGEMFMGALVPGLILVGLYIVYVATAAFLRPELAPTVPYERKGNRSLAVGVLLALLPPLVLILLVLGSIVAGVATVNQAGAIGAAGATVMAGYRLYEGRRGAFSPTVIAIGALCALGLIVHGFHVNLRKIYTNEDVLGVVLAAIASALLAFALFWSGWRALKVDQTMKYVVEETTKTTSLVFAILLGAVMLTAAFRAFGGEVLVRDFLQRLPGGFWGQFTIAMLIIFILGFFLDFIEITVVVVPIIAPILLADPSANITAVWLGVMIALNVQTSFLTPPFGFALFYLRGVAPASVNTLDIYKGVVPFIVLQLVALGVVGAWPSLVDYLPNRVLLLADSAPPPTNPRLQYCMENYVARAFVARGEKIHQAIDQARALDLRVLPERFRGALTQSFAKAQDAFRQMDAIKKAERAVAQSAAAYRPLHAKVREIERDVRRIDQEISKQETIVSRAGQAAVAVAQRARQRISDLKAQRDALVAQVPARWKRIHSEFSATQKTEQDARRAYRRAVDNAYDPLKTVLAAIDDGKKLEALAEDVRALGPLLQSGAPSAALERTKFVRARLHGIVGVDGITEALGRAQRDLRGPAPDPKSARRALEKAAASFGTETAWRTRAAAELLPKLEAYEASIVDTIGLRGQTRLPNPVAVDVAACSATPRDINLNF
jgi:tripartite ATP-independent transporter DctM subunit